MVGTSEQVVYVNLQKFNKYSDYLQDLILKDNRFEFVDENSPFYNSDIIFNPDNWNYYMGTVGSDEYEW